MNRHAAALSFVMSLGGLASASPGCSRHDLVDFAMASAYRPTTQPALGGPGKLLKTLALLDRQVHAQGRRLAALGGSDSHEDHLRATTFVLTSARTVDAIRASIAGGRTCVRDGAACTLTARKPGSPGVHVGDALEHAELVEVSATGDDIELFLDGETVATAKSEVFATVKVPARCSVLRARVGHGWSSPIYVNCSL